MVGPFDPRIEEVKDQLRPKGIEDLTWSRITNPTAGLARAFGTGGVGPSHMSDHIQYVYDLATGGQAGAQNIVQNFFQSGGYVAGGVINQTIAFEFHHTPAASAALGIVLNIFASIVQGVSGIPVTALGGPSSSPSGDSDRMVIVDDVLITCGGGAGPTRQIVYGFDTIVTPGTPNWIDLNSRDMQSNSPSVAAAPRAQLFGGDRVGVPPGWPIAPVSPAPVHDANGFAWGVLVDEDQGPFRPYERLTPFILPAGRAIIIAQPNLGAPIEGLVTMVSVLWREVLF